MLNRPECKRVALGQTDAATLCRLFDGLFLSRFHTCLRGGGGEPLYKPAVENEPAVITFRSDYVSSALHEVAHRLGIPTLAVPNQYAVSSKQCQGKS